LSGILSYDDTIVAVSTPPGAGGIGIVRMSGPEALRILRSLFRPSSTGPEQAPRCLCHGRLVDRADGTVVDEVLATFMPAPHTYTRQDVVEINTHGGPLVVRRTLELCLELGARLAEPGEFTLRAFLNGRIDLAQAEAVRDLVAARTSLAARQAVAQLDGLLSSRVRTVRERLQSCLAALEAWLDFDEGEEPGLEPALQASNAEIEALVRSADAGIMRREGLRAAIVGRPNVGKSSLLNALLRSDRAIVTDVPGTTRDTVEEAADLGGLTVVFVDTAGLDQEETPDPVERLGRERSRRALESAHMVLLVLDASRPLEPADYEIARLAAQAPAAVVVWNKVDLNGPAQAAPLTGYPEVRVSALTGTGLDRLERVVVEQALGPDLAGQEAVLSSARQKMAAVRALEAARSALAGWQQGLGLDAVAEDIRVACRALGEITGETVEGDLLERIFATFCVGK
jgi:tRNA modification GTPase